MINVGNSAQGIRAFLWHSEVGEWKWNATNTQTNLLVKSSQQSGSKGSSETQTFRDPQGESIRGNTCIKRVSCHKSRNNTNFTFHSECVGSTEDRVTCGHCIKRRLFHCNVGPVHEGNLQFPLIEQRVRQPAPSWHCLDCIGCNSMYRCNRM